ncbi:beta-galactosidase [Flavihumibacter sp. CACIAM 22H1]|uniref:beta-galactosidase n=1 Tax=Flavihumibacter sp. CACIAM 22H1 TaxID=1812911 RepID=UPI0007A7F13F|nr:beta-galactosidase [Flavihumibacter sp. CACIAM 22H1]KYP15991.1 MAG: hypothetical protein A1D16_06945 [Flavihumibacter sp. CACIAM 22H1]
MKRSLFFAAVLFLAQTGVGQITTIDITAVPAAKLESLPMEGKDPVGNQLKVNNQFFTKNDKAWFPVMGEMHYNRVPAKEWKEELLKMRAAGITIVASYVFWNEHETSRGKWDWEGNRDLRKFLLTAQECGLYVWLRIGPWSHGEQLHGGHPEYVHKMKGKRSNDPEYVKAVFRLFEQIGRETKDLYFINGGPIIGVQLENEYASGKAEHISVLKEIAVGHKINPVYWSVTANTVFNDELQEVIPLQGAYPYRGWEAGGGKATKDFLYGNDQWIMTDALGKLYYELDKFPKGLCEQGAGSQMTFANRFVVEPHVVEAHLQNQVGRGMNLVGYYMFKGGTQTPGLKEPGCPESYDFQAPISEFGLIRPSYRYLKILHHFINDFGEQLAPMHTVEAANPVTNELDSMQLRYITRVKDDQGFIFLCNTQVRLNMPDKEVNLQIRLKNEQIEFPSFLLKGQTSPVLPFNLKLGTATLKYAVAQPFSKIQNGNHLQVFFQNLPGVNPALSLQLPEHAVIETPGWKRTQVNDRYELVAEGGNMVRLKLSDGMTVSLHFMQRSEAENAWRINKNGAEFMIITKADLLYSKDTLQFYQLNRHAFSARVYPSDRILFQDKKSTTTASYRLYNWMVKPVNANVRIKKEQAATRVSIPAAWPSSINNVFLKIQYSGNAAVASLGSRVVTDNLFNGTDWMLGLKRFGGKEISLTVTPWDEKVTGIADYLAATAKKQVPVINKVEILPVYQVRLRLN